LTRIHEQSRPVPDGIILEDFLEDEELGILKRGKEADVYLVERRAANASCLLAAKRYVPPEARAFHNNAQYHAHARLDGVVRDRGDRTRATRSGREQRAMDSRSRFGKGMLHERWIENEWAVLNRLWDAGVNVPYPVARLSDGTLMQYLGDPDVAAPRLAQARIEKAELPGLYEQLRENLKALVRAGLVHGDLSAYNILYWDTRLWIIDVPQAVPFLENLDATDFLHRDVTNVCAWFVQKGLAVDPEDLFVDLLNVQFDYRMEDMFFSKGT
jgi:RIO kinase 1